MSVLYPPTNFGSVENNLYRSSYPTEINLLFLNQLKLKTVIILSEECPEAFALYIEKNSINPIFIYDDNVTIMDNSEFGHISEEMVVKALTILLDNSNYPLLITCKSGKVLTGVVIGCLRKLQGWSLVSIFEEYRRFSGNRHQQQYEQFIELFDTDLIKISNESPLFLRSFKSQIKLAIEADDKSSIPNENNNNNGTFNNNNSSNNNNNAAEDSNETKSENK